MWLKFKVMGKQTHASMPGSGINAHKIGMMFALSVDEALHDNFSDRDELFEPPFSTFEITKKEANVENINTIPGSDVFYMDMRILPDENLDDILRIIDEIRTYSSTNTRCVYSWRLYSGAMLRLPLIQSTPCKDSCQRYQGNARH